MSVTMKKIATRKTVAILREKSLLMDSSCTTSPARLWVDTLRAFIVPSEWLTWSLSNLLTGMKSCVRFARLLMVSFLNSFGFLIIFSWIHGAVRTWAVEHNDPTMFTSGALCRRSDIGLIFGRNLIQAGAVFLRSIRCRFVIVDDNSYSRVYPVWICTPFSSLFFKRDELHGRLFASLCSRGVPRGMGLSGWRSWESTEHRSGRCLVFELCLEVVSMFRKNSVQCLSSSMSNSWGTVFWQWSRKSRNTPCFPWCRSFPSTTRWMDWTRDFALSRLASLLYSDASWTDESDFGLPSCGCDRAIGQPNGAILGSWSLFHSDNFRCTFHHHKSCFVLARMVEGCSRVKACSILAFICAS